MGGEDAGEEMWGEGGCGSLRKQEERHCSEEDAVRGFDYFIYLAVLGLSCSMWDLQPSLWHVGSSS